MDGGHFQVGGALREGALYVLRPADVNLPRRLLAGEFCHVLAPRQMGKSSLRFRVAGLLEARGVRCAHVDLSGLGTMGVDQESWHLALLETIRDELGFPDPQPSWSARAHLPMMQRWLRGLRDWLEDRASEPIVIFLDEIDTVRSLPFSTEDLFAAIRSIYNERNGVPAWRRVTFCIFGVARPSELIRDVRRTPFNIGTGLRLEDFTVEEARTLLAGLSMFEEDGPARLDAVLRWTLGHPYMTQRLCDAMVEFPDRSSRPEELVRALVHEHFLRDGEHSDLNLRSAAHQVRGAVARGQDLIGLYRRVLLGAELVASEADDDVAALMMTGMVRRQAASGRTLLKVRNPIFQAVFDLDWVERNEDRRPFTQALGRWLESGRGARDDDTLLHGARLEEGLRWAEGRQDLTAEERDFLLESQASERRAAEARAALAMATERARTLRLFLWALGLALVVLLILFALLAWEAKRARLEGARAERHVEEAALAARRELGVRASATSAEVLDIKDALGAAVRAVGSRSDSAPPPEARTGLLDALWTWPLVVPERTLWAGEHEVRQALASPDGRWIAASDAAGRVLLWSSPADAARELVRVEGPVWTLAASPGSDALAAGAEDGLVRVWTLAGDQGAPRTLRGHTAPISYVEFDPSGQRLLSSSSDDTTRIWDLEGGGSLTLAQPGPVTEAHFSRDGRWVVTASARQEARVWDTRSGALVARWVAHDDWLYFADFSPDGAEVVTTGGDNLVRLWTARGQALATLAGHRDRPWRAVRSRDGRWLISVAMGGEVRRWDLSRSGQSEELRGHRGWVHAVEFTPDGGRFLTASMDGSVMVWDSATAEPRAVLLGQAGDLLSARFADHGRAVITAASDGRVLLYRLPPGEGAAACACGEASLVRRPDARALAVSAGGQYTLCGDSVRSFDGGGHLLRAYTDAEGCLEELALSSDGETLAAMTLDGSITIWRTDGLGVPSRSGPGDLVQASLAMAPGGERVLVFDHERARARTWEPKTGASWDWGLSLLDAVWTSDGARVLHWSPAGPTLSDHRGDALQRWEGGEVERSPLRLSPDGSRFAGSASPDGVGVWSLKGDQPQRVWKDIGWNLLDLAWSPDGRRLAVSSNQGGVQVLDVETGLELARMDPLGSPLYQLSFDETGRYLLALSGVGHAALWDVAAARRIGSPGGRATLRGCAFAPEGEAVYTAGDDGVIRAWSLDLAQNMGSACEILEWTPRDAEVERVCASWRQLQGAAPERPRDGASSPGGPR